MRAHTTPLGGAEAVRDLRPTRENLNWAVREWLGKRVRPGDLTLIYFAGQAVALPGGGGDHGGPRVPPADRRPSAFLDATGWSLGDALDPLAGANAGPILCLLDTSPRGRGRSVVPVGDDPTLGARMMKNIARWPGVAVWLAADGRPADDGDGEAGGPFASAFLRALEPAGRRNNLLACLDALGDDRTLSAQGFRTLGGLPPGATLWPEDRRNPRIADPDLVLQRGHAAAVRAIAFNADGSLMASGAEDSTIRLWRARDRTLLRVLPYHANGVSCLAISPDGRLLASGDGMGGVRVWDLVKDEPMALLDPSPHDGNIVAVGFLPDGRSLVSADTDARWALWDLSGPSARLRALRERIDAGGPTAGVRARPGPVAAAMALTAPGGDDRVGLFRPDRERADGDRGRARRRDRAAGALRRRASARGRDRGGPRRGPGPRSRPGPPSAALRGPDHGAGAGGGPARRSSRPRDCTYSRSTARAKASGTTSRSRRRSSSSSSRPMAAGSRPSPGGEATSGPGISTPRPASRGPSPWRSPPKAGP